MKIRLEKGNDVADAAASRGSRSLKSTTAGEAGHRSKPAAQRLRVSYFRQVIRRVVRFDRPGKNDP